MLLQTFALEIDSHTWSWRVRSNIISALRLGEVAQEQASTVRHCIVGSSEQYPIPGVVVVGFLVGGDVDSDVGCLLRIILRATCKRRRSE